MPDPSKPTTTTAKTGDPFIWITNNTDHSIILALRPREQPGSKTLSSPPMLSLEPGATVIDKAFWDKWKSEDEEEATRLLTDKIPGDDHRHRRAERAGQVYLVEGPTVKNKAMPFDGIDPDRARALVPEVRSEILLRQIRETERRAPVLETVRLELDRFARGSRPQSAA
jgi:hypothetical protein